MPTLNVEVVRPDRSIPDQVVEAIRQAIVDGALAPGRRLTERELMELTGVSRTSIREAVRQLQSFGLVESLATRGMRVATLSSEAVRHIYEVRDALEPSAAELFVHRATDDEVAELVSYVDILGTDPIATLNAVSKFDELLLAGARNPLLREILWPLHTRIHALRRISVSMPGRQEASTREYRALAAAIQDRSAPRAVRAAHAHIRAAQKSALAAMAMLEDRAWSSAAWWQGSQMAASPVNPTTERPDDSAEGAAAS